MKKRYFIMIFAAVFVMIVSLVFLLEIPKGTQESTREPVEEPAQVKVLTEDVLKQFQDIYYLKTSEISGLLDAFMDLTYNCDYQERCYYDGAEAYMTEECYSNYVPMQDPEELTGAGESYTPYVSYLQGTEYYYASLTGEKAECLALVKYSATDNPLGVQESLIYLSLVNAGGEWKISSIEIMDH